LNEIEARLSGRFSKSGFERVMLFFVSVLKAQGFTVGWSSLAYSGSAAAAAELNPW